MIRASPIVAVPRFAERHPAPTLKHRPTERRASLTVAVLPLSNGRDQAELGFWPRATPAQVEHARGRACLLAAGSRGCRAAASGTSAYTARPSFGSHPDGS